MQLTEIAFFTDDVEAMTRFYQNFLNKEPVVQADGMAIFMVDHTKIFIHKQYKANEGELPPENHMAFTVEDINIACQSLKKQGIQIEIEPREYYWGRSAYLRDPDGQLIELNEKQSAG